MITPEQAKQLADKYFNTDKWDDEDIQTVIAAIINEAIEPYVKDAERIKFLEQLHLSSKKTDMHFGGTSLGVSIYHRRGIGSILSGEGVGKSIREAIDAFVMKEST